MKSLANQRTYMGWVIELKYYFPAIAGVLFWGEPPEHLEPVRTAVFKTRRQAMKARDKLYPPYAGRVFRAKVIIEILK